MKKIKGLIKECILEVLKERLMESITIVIIPTGYSDDWSRPIYKSQDGRIYVDINCGSGSPSIYSTTDEGEPDMPLKNYEISTQGWGEVKESGEEQHNNEKTKKDVYARLIQLGFFSTGTAPRNYVEYYRYNFATVQCIIDTQTNEAELYLFYDNEGMAENNKSKKFKLPMEYSLELVVQIVNVCRKWKVSISKDEPVYGGMDDLQDGFDPLSQGPNAPQENPYPQWNNKMRTMETNIK